ncbi:DUF6509 family protein [Bacillus spongiae]|uniref:DUF6509 family protein n=1 Tax=Bacillus spongiae TaxID=2683610 RepID=A0ABU8HBA5_9BACI
MKILEHTVEKLEDPTGILIGDRYEFFLTIEVPEEDELFSEHGLYMRAIVAVEENASRLVQYQIYERTTEKYLDFALEEAEENMVLEYCQQHME